MPRRVGKFLKWDSRSARALSIDFEMCKPCMHAGLCHEGQLDTLPLPFAAICLGVLAPAARAILLSAAADPAFRVLAGVSFPAAAFPGAVFPAAFPAPAFPAAAFPGAAFPAAAFPAAPFPAAAAIAFSALALLAAAFVF